MLPKLEPLALDKMPLAEPPTWTEDGLLRQVVYLGEREDKPARLVVRKPKLSVT